MSCAPCHCNAQLKIFIVSHESKLTFAGPSINLALCEASAKRHLLRWGLMARSDDKLDIC